MQEIVQRIRGRKVIWLLPGFEEAFWAGQHHQSPQGLLDALLPHVESGQIVVVGEIDPLAYELVDASVQPPATSRRTRPWPSRATGRTLPA